MKIVPMSKDEERRFLKKLGGNSLTEEEEKRRESAATRLKEALSSDPFYKNWTMQDWRNLQSSQALAD